MNGQRKNIHRRTILVGGAAATTGLLFHARSQAQVWPAKPIRIVIGYTPGGSLDATAREVSAQLQRLLGQPVVIDYKPGSAGALAAAEVARSPADGYTLGVFDNGPMTISPAFRRPAYDPVDGFTAISMVVQVPHVLVVPPSPAANNLAELLAMMRKAPGRLNYGSGGNGSVGHMAAELLKVRTKTFATHIPYRGGAPVIVDLIGGNLQYSFLTTTSTNSFIKSGQLKALGVTSLTRFSGLPNVPTIAEQGVAGYEAPGWIALMGPAGMPANIVEPINKALHEALAVPAVVSRLEQQGQAVVTAKGDTKQTISAEIAAWRKLVAEQKLVIDG